MALSSCLFVHFSINYRVRSIIFYLYLKKNEKIKNIAHYSLIVLYFIFFGAFYTYLNWPCLRQVRALRISPIRTFPVTYVCLCHVYIYVAG
jgi:hypothetical protein